MWRKVLLTGCVSFCLLGGVALRAQTSCTTKEEITPEQLNRTQKSVEAMVKELKNTDFFLVEFNKISAAGSREQQMKACKELAGRLMPVLEMQAELEWIKPAAIRAALDVMKKHTGFDAPKAEARLKELDALQAAGYNGIYVGDKQAMVRAEKALNLKRELMLQSPDVDVDKVLTVKYNLGERANFVGAGSLGIQPNNWSNQTTASRKNFQAEVIELSGLKSGNVQRRTIFKPSMNGAAVTDLAPNWDGKRMMFTSLDSTRRWQVFEMGIDGTGCKQVTCVNEPDLEFFDAAYLPDGRIVAVSNIGYHGVPCVNGSDEVGNMVLYDPRNGNLRRITFDQDANWNPIVLANGKIMYTRWEYTDLTHYFSRIVMHANPDGTEQKSLYGSGSMFPNSIFDMKPLPTASN
ncbi:MAG: formylglycine-generating enzyme family protein, partial [Tannerellaceae bacterium]